MRKCEEFLESLKACKAPQHEVPWAECEVAFMGADNYTLKTVETRAKVNMVRGGFQTVLEVPVEVQASEFLGKSVSHATILDIELRLPSMVMHMAQMYPERFPKHVVRGGKTVGIGHG